MLPSWPASDEELIREQEALAAAGPPPWRPAPALGSVAGCFVCFPRGIAGPGSSGDPAWAGAAAVRAGRLVGTALVSGEAGAPYKPGLLALREGPILETAVRALPEKPDVLLVNASGRDHPRRAGLALQLGARLEVPTIGVTHRPLLAEGAWPGDERGAASPLRLSGERVGLWLCTRAGRRPLVVHSAWRTDAETAATVVLETATARTPEPLRQARHIARWARARAAIV